MDSEIRAAVPSEVSTSPVTPKKFVPMLIGNAVVYVEHQGEAITDYDDIYPVSPSPTEVFQTAVVALKECVRVVGEHIEQLSGKVLPKEMEIEFSITFDAKAKGALIPIFVTAEHGLQTGLKVKAVWKGFSENKPTNPVEE
jgi:hypothetical protein